MAAFKGKTVLITGASEGIGRATARVFFQEGAHLILVARNKSRLEELKKELLASQASLRGQVNQDHQAPQGNPINSLNSIQQEITLRVVDLSQPAQVKAFFDEGPAFDVAVNNAGTEGTIKEIQDLNLEDYSLVFDLNVQSLFQCLCRQVQHFRAHKKSGSIVNVSSILGFRGIAGSSLYVASKHAVIGFTKAIAIEQVNHNIRVNSVSPGSTDTPMIRRVLGDSNALFVGTEPSERMAKPDEIAEAILWLSSEKAQHIVGHNLVIDGGMTAGV